MLYQTNSHKAIFFTLVIKVTYFTFCLGKQVYSSKAAGNCIPSQRATRDPYHAKWFIQFSNGLRRPFFFFFKFCLQDKDFW